MTTIKRTLPYPAWLEQAAKFLSVGILNTALDAGLYFVLTRWLGFSTLPTLAKGISYGVGILNSFYWNKSWTFGSDTGTMTAFVPFVVANLAALAINAGLMHVCLNTLGLPEIPSLALATGSTFLWNFTISKFVIFKSGVYSIGWRESAHLRRQRRRHGNGPQHRADVAAGLQWKDDVE
jgi:putative flippase GtrA